MGNFVQYNNRVSPTEAFMGSYERAYGQSSDNADRQRLFKLQQAAHRAEFDYELGARDKQKVADQVRSVEEFASVYPEHAELARKIGRPLSASEVNDFRETDRASKKATDAATEKQKLADYVKQSGDKEAQDYFNATGKLHPKLTRADTTANDPKKKELADLDQQQRAYSTDLQYALRRQKAASFDPTKNRHSERSTQVGDALAGREADYWNANNDARAAQARIEAVQKRRLELSGGLPIEQSQAGVFQQPPQVSQPAAAAQYPQPGHGMGDLRQIESAPGAQQPMQQQPAAMPAQPAPAEVKVQTLQWAAAANKLNPAAVAQMPAATTQQAQRLLQQLQQTISDPAQLRQEFYRQMIAAGLDPTKDTADFAPAPGTSALQTQGR